MTTPIIEPINTRVHRFKAAQLDPVTIYVEEYSNTASRIIVQCYAQAWTAYWGSHGDRPVEDFIRNAGPEYITDNLRWGNNSLMLKAQEGHQARYLLRIVKAMQEHFRLLKEEA